MHLIDLPVLRSSTYPLLFKGTVHQFYMRGPRNPLKLRNTVYFKHFFHPCGRYGPFYGVMGRSNHAVSVTGGPLWTRPLHHKIEPSGQCEGTNDKGCK